jgi:hypothetical protein
LNWRVEGGRAVRISELLAAMQEVSKRDATTPIATDMGKEEEEEQK